MNAFTAQSLQQALTFPFKDSRWGQKLAIGTGLVAANFIIPLIPAVFLAGYFSRMIRRTAANGGEPSLPEWENWGGLLNDGIKLLGASLVYTFPVSLLFMVGYAAIVLPSFLISLASSSSGNLPPHLAMLPFLTMTVGMALFGIGMVASLVIGAIAPPALLHTAVKNEFSAAFRFSEWWKIFRANLGGFLIVYIFLMGVYSLLMFAMQLLYMTLVLCCLIPIVIGVAGVYLGWVGNTLFAQAYLGGLPGAQSISPDESPATLLPA